ncbi:MAG: hypothetical protein II629_08325 [Ruminococcus sp.]|nr:hypothetical protein [Ruminococcus sp.]
MAVRRNTSAADRADKAVGKAAVDRTADTVADNFAVDRAADRVDMDKIADTAVVEPVADTAAELSAAPAAPLPLCTDRGFRQIASSYPH